jgi:predicted metal-binding protein
MKAEYTDRIHKELVDQALLSGASGARFISPKDISVEEELAILCREPECDNYGLSPSCPPHVSGPSGFRKMLEKCDHALVIKIDVPMEFLLSSERNEIMRLLHEIVASAENFAVQMGFINSKAFAGGSCKMIFCGDHLDCKVVAEIGACRYHQSARQSMSGFGINVLKLKRAAGWISSKTPRENDLDTVSMETVCGLVLIG